MEVLLLAGCAGCSLMFAADLVLYLPSERVLCTASIYFSRIDPNGNNLQASPMRDISDERLMLGGVLGPIAATLYALGFAGMYQGMRPSEGAMSPLLAASPQGRLVDSCGSDAVPLQCSRMQPPSTMISRAGTQAK